MGKLYGAEGTARWIELRTARRFEEARAFSRTLLAEVAAARDLDPKELLAEAIRANYEAVFAAMPTPAWCTYGNVDARSSGRTTCPKACRWSTAASRRSTASGSGSSAAGSAAGAAAIRT
ncbi:hypothetical protein [Fodinicola feengrottensis]|uniref:hypothetical protein n=1 Tax=Fodinicola feengrottensis TaxID=435914 RepID=UPI0024425B6B|nr:hypothetical protein [Fodinicola feengrottensis]